MKNMNTIEAHRPNFQALTDYLNTGDYPRRDLTALLLLLSKPAPDRIDDADQEAEILIG